MHTINPISQRIRFSEWMSVWASNAEARGMEGRWVTGDLLHGLQQARAVRSWSALGLEKDVSSWA
eukprot:5925379-Pleurochrysis_carterae.AAC.1